MRTCLAALLGVSALFVFSGCRHKMRQHRTGPSSNSSVAIAPPIPKLPPLVADSWLIELEVKGFGSSEVAVPLGATQPRSIVIALHGPADRPEWACGAWRGIAGPAPFVLCPRGTPRSDFAPADARYTFGGPDEVARELRASLAALKQRFGAHVAPGPVVLTGLELGADRAASLALQEPTFFARLALIDAPPETWPSSQAALFGREGGERVLFACEPPDRTAAEFKALLTRRGGAEGRAVFLTGPGSGLGAASVKQLAALWPWLETPGTPRPQPENLAGNPVTRRLPEMPPLR